MRKCKPNEDVCLEHCLPLKGMRYCEDGRDRCEHDFGERRDTHFVEIQGERRAFVVRACLDCGAWLSLGHSDETPVAVEVRAAEIAADGANPHDLFRNDKPSWFGWCQHVAATHSGDDEANCLPHEEAGWLAREIATHSDGGIE